MKPMIYLTREKNDLTGNETHDLPHKREEWPDREWNPWFTSHERRTTWQGMKPMIYLTREKNDLTGNETHDLPHTGEEWPDRKWNPWFTSHMCFISCQVILLPCEVNHVFHSLSGRSSLVWGKSLVSFPVRSFFSRVR
jgi:hypothetical protein